MDIRNIFKRKEKNKILWCWKYEGMLQDSSDIIEPCLKNLPPYWKNLRKNYDEGKTIKFRNLVHRHDVEDMDKDEKEELIKDLKDEKIWSQGNGISRINASTCPSFNDIFKNCYVFKTPVSFYIEGNKDGIQITSRDKRVLDIESHSLSSQLWGDFNPNLISVKFQMTTSVKTSRKKTKMIFLDNVYYTDLPFRVIPGVLELSPNSPTSFNLNTTIDKRFFEHKEKYSKLVKAGTVLAMIYMPDGILDIEDKNFSPSYRKYFLADGINQLNKK